MNVKPFFFNMISIQIHRSKTKGLLTHQSSHFLMSSVHPNVARHNQTSMHPSSNNRRASPRHLVICYQKKVGQTGPFDRPSRTSMPWCMSAGRKLSESRGSAHHSQKQKVNAGTTVSYTHLTLPTKRIV